jgi:hypothetical protein
LFCCFIEVTMTVVKSVSDGLRDSDTQLNLNLPLNTCSGPLSKHQQLEIVIRIEILRSSYGRHLDSSAV